MRSVSLEDRIIDGSVRIGKMGMYLTGRTEKGYSVTFNFVQLPELRTMGVSNITADQRYILFIDYDRIRKEDLYAQLRFLSKDFGVSHFLVLRTGPDRYHIICFEKFMLTELEALLDETLCDYSFKTVAVKSDKGWILRIYPKLDLDGNKVSDKPELVDCFVMHEPNRELSRAHFEFFSKLFPSIKGVLVSDKFISMLDNNTIIKIIKYGTSKRDLLVDVGLENLIDSKNLTVVWEDG